RVKLSEGTLSFEEAARVIRTRPNDFSPGAALRPILQDAVLPVAVNIAGPTELLYLWQIRPLYELIQATPSLLLPRITATFVDPSVRRAAKKTGLDDDRLFEAIRPDERIRTLANSDPKILEVEEKVRDLLSTIDRLAGSKPTKGLKRRRAALADQAEKMIDRFRQERIEAWELEGQRYGKIAHALAPGGKPQDRVLNIFELLNKYGPYFPARCRAMLDPMVKEHQCVFVTTMQQGTET
ncbi:MAG: bacillithiol biosynthesis cysteine-adding enzyme BshC, partial [Planctomycetes bacterium]|nr:bacillithiol biosynthesis cysteine-adding enzyme BshC [Planctomycetota bacterium]